MFVWGLKASRRAALSMAMNALVCFIVLACFSMQCFCNFGAIKLCPEKCEHSEETVQNYIGIELDPGHSCKGARYRPNVPREVISGRRFTGDFGSDGFYIPSSDYFMGYPCKLVNDSSCPVTIRYSPYMRYGCERDAEGILWYKTLARDEVEKALDSLRELGFDEPY